MTRTSGANSRDPDFIIYKNGAVVSRAETAPAASESLTDACYNFMVTR